MPTKNLIVVSDLHCGCQLGLCPPEGAKMDEGGTYKPNRVQRKMWAYWLDFWGRWVPWATHGEPYSVLVNGDAIDNEHHGSSSQWTHNTKDQRECAEAVLRPIVDKCERLFMTRGTGVHDGESGREIETLARTLGAVRQDGKAAPYDWRIRVGSAIIHALHTIGTTSSSAHEASAVNAELTAEYVESARWRFTPPDYAIRSHRHRCIVVDIDTANGYGAGIVTPGWQGKTPYVWKIAGGRLAPPQFGGVMVRAGDNEHYYLRKTYSIKPSKAVTA